MSGGSSTGPHQASGTNVRIQPQNADGFPRNILVTFSFADSVPIVPGKRMPSC